MQRKPSAKATKKESKGNEKKQLKPLIDDERRKEKAFAKPKSHTMGAKTGSMKIKVINKDKKNEEGSETQEGRRQRARNTYQAKLREARTKKEGGLAEVNEKASDDMVHEQ